MPALTGLKDIINAHSSDLVTLASEVTSLGSGKVSKSGDTMTGDLDLGTHDLDDVGTIGFAHGTITSGTDASSATVLDLDGGVDKVLIKGISVQSNNGATGYVVGGSADPEADDQLATKHYVDTTVPAAQVNSDWDETDPTSKAYILHKPSIPDITGKVDIDTPLTSTKTIRYGTSSDPSHATIEFFTENGGTSGQDAVRVDIRANQPVSPGGWIRFNSSMPGWNDGDMLILGTRTDTNTTPFITINISPDDPDDPHVLDFNSRRLRSVSDPVDSTDAATKSYVDTAISDNAQVQSNWTETDNTEPSFILNKPTIPAAQIQSDWNQSNTAAVDYIQNKPAIPADPVQSDWDEMDSSELSYIQNKPTIPAAQVQTDWNATSGMGVLLNKPILATVATSGSYNDLSDQPTIPAEQVQSDWNESDSNSKAYIQNKPTISGVFVPITSTSGGLTATVSNVDGDFEVVQVQPIADTPGYRNEISSTLDDAHLSFSREGPGPSGSNTDTYSASLVAELETAYIEQSYRVPYDSAVHDQRLALVVAGVRPKYTLTQGGVQLSFGSSGDTNYIPPTSFSTGGELSGDVPDNDEEFAGWLYGQGHTNYSAGWVCPANWVWNGHHNDVSTEPAQFRIYSVDGATITLFDKWYSVSYELTGLGITYTVLDAVPLQEDVAFLSDLTAVSPGDTYVPYEKFTGSQINDSISYELSGLGYIRIGRSGDIDTGTLELSGYAYTLPGVDQAMGWTTRLSNGVKEFAIGGRQAGLTDALSYIESSSAPNGDWDFHGHIIHNVLDPVADQDAATKSYVDTAIESINPSNKVNVLDSTGVTSITQQSVDGTISSLINLTQNASMAVQSHVVSKGTVEGTVQLMTDGSQGGVNLGASDTSSGASVHFIVSTGGISANSNRLQDLVDPTAAQDAATKSYVDTEVGAVNGKISSAASSTNPALDQAAIESLIEESISGSLVVASLSFDAGTGNYNIIDSDATDDVTAYVLDGNYDIIAKSAMTPEPTTGTALYQWCVFSEAVVDDGTTAGMLFVLDDRDDLNIGDPYDFATGHVKWQRGKNTVTNFTTAQQDALDSGANTTNIAQIGTNTTNIATNASNISALTTTVGTKVDKITTAGVRLYSHDGSTQGDLALDTAPASASGNPISSGGVYTALAAKADTTALASKVDKVETTGVSLYGHENATQTQVTIDSAPASASTNPVSSGGVYTALGNKIDKLVTAGVRLYSHDGSTQGELPIDSTVSSTSNNPVSSSAVASAISGVNTSLGNKVDKLTTTGDYAYTHSGGTQGETAVSTNATASSLAKYQANSALTVGAPVAGTDAATKTYADTKVAKDETGTELTAYTHSGATQSQTPVSDSASGSAIAKYKASGALSVGTAANSDEAINKAFLDARAILRTTTPLSLTNPTQDQVDAIDRYLMYSCQLTFNDLWADEVIAVSGFLSFASALSMNFTDYTMANGDLTLLSNTAQISVSGYKGMVTAIWDNRYVSFSNAQFVGSPSFQRCGTVVFTGATTSSAMSFTNCNLVYIAAGASLTISGNLAGTGTTIVIAPTGSLTVGGTFADTLNIVGLGPNAALTYGSSKRVAEAFNALVQTNAFLRQAQVGNFLSTVVFPETLTPGGQCVIHFPDKGNLTDKLLVVTAASAYVYQNESVSGSSLWTSGGGYASDFTVAAASDTIGFTWTQSTRTLTFTDPTEALIRSTSIQDSFDTGDTIAVTGAGFSVARVETIESLRAIVAGLDKFKATKLPGGVDPADFLTTLGSGYMALFDDGLYKSVVRSTGGITLTDPTQAQIDALPRAMTSSITFNFTTATGTVYINGFHPASTYASQVGNDLQLVINATAGGKGIGLQDIGCQVVFTVTGTLLSRSFYAVGCPDVRVSGAQFTVLGVEDIINSGLYFYNVTWGGTLYTRYGTTLALDGTSAGIVYASAGGHVGIFSTATGALTITDGGGVIVDKRTSNLAELWPRKGTVLGVQAGTTLTDPTQAQIDALGRYLSSLLTIDITSSSYAVSPTLKGFIGARAATGSSSQIPYDLLLVNTGAASFTLNLNENHLHAYIMDLVGPVNIKTCDYVVLDTSTFAWTTTSNMYWLNSRIQVMGMATTISKLYTNETRIEVFANMSIAELSVQGPTDVYVFSSYQFNVTTVSGSPTMLHVYYMGAAPGADSTSLPETYIKANSDTAAQELYGHTGKQQFTIPVNSTPVANTIPKYDEEGILHSSTPDITTGDGTQVANVSYVSQQIVTVGIANLSDPNNILAEGITDDEASAVSLAQLNPGAIIFYPEEVVS